MKSFLFNGFRAVTMLAIVVLVAARVSAGDALQFSNTKSRPDPNQKPKLQDEAARSRLDFGSRGPVDQVTPGVFKPDRRDPRAERQARNAEDEKKNWMVLDPGQLDAEDEDNAAFGIKEYNLEKSNTKRDYFFAPPEDKSDRLGRPRQQQLGRPTGKNKNPAEGNPKGASRELDPNGKEANADKPAPKEGRTDHVSKALDMKELLAPGKANSLAPAEDKTTKLWKEILGSGATSTSESRPEVAGRREDASAADGFRPAASAAASFRAQDSSPAFNFRNETSSRSAPAATPGPSGSPSTGFTPPSAPLIPRTPESSFSRPSGPPVANRVPTPDSSYGSYGSRPNGFGPGTPDSPYGQQPPPRRTPSSSFDLPARPGYGGR